MSELIFLNKPVDDFEQLYLKTREKENRVYPDEVVKSLPETERGHPHESEWRQRKNSALKLIHHFKHQPAYQSLLEIGCGNGWLSALIAKNTHLQVSGIDINRQELVQACRVFHSRDNLSFFYGDIFQDIFPPESFDLVLLSSSIQYFDDLTLLLNRLRYFMKKEGSIFISDSPLYTIATLKKAVRNSVRYYISLDFPEMIEVYHHHLKETIFDNFKATYIHNPRKFPNPLLNKLFPFRKIPFPIIEIQLSKSEEIIESGKAI